MASFLSHRRVPQHCQNLNIVENPINVLILSLFLTPGTQGVLPASLKAGSLYPAERPTSSSTSAREDLCLVAVVASESLVASGLSSWRSAPSTWCWWQTFGFCFWWWWASAPVSPWMSRQQFGGFCRSWKSRDWCTQSNPRSTYLLQLKAGCSCVSPSSWSASFSSS